MSLGIRANASATRRRAILDAALDLFVENGVSATNLDQILELSGASVGSFYHHFGGKIEVAAALYVEILDGYCRGFVAELSRHRGAETSIKAGVRYHLKWVAQNPKGAMYIAYRHETETLRESAAGTVKRFFGELDSWLQALAEKKAIRKLPFDIYWALWLGSAEIFTRWWVLGSRDPKHLRRAEVVLPLAVWETLKGTKP